MKIVVWGLPLHTHTHSYIHQAFHRASSRVGIESVWLEDSERCNEQVRQGDIVICCGVSDKNLFYKKDVKYVLHNSDRNDLRQGEFITLQVYTHDVLERNVEKINDLTYWENSSRTLYQPWATDLLPEEIEKIEPSFSQSSTVYWIGSIMSGIHGNIEELTTYSELCEKNGIHFKNARNLSIQQNYNLTRESRHSPVIQGKWQAEKGYIPCRIFKNISYGCWSETNSSTTASLLGLDCHTSIESMYLSLEKSARDKNEKKTLEMMNLVKEKHTYVNRLKNIMSFIGA